MIAIGNGEPCPVCGKPWSEEHVKDFLKEIDTALFEVE